MQILAEIQKLFGGKIQKIFPLKIHPRAVDRPDEDVVREPLAVNLWDMELLRELEKLAKLASVWEEKGAKAMAAEQVVLAIMRRCALVPQELRVEKRESHLHSWIIYTNILYSGLLSLD